jgi:small-conductance mechanosensitive channel
MSEVLRKLLGELYTEEIANKVGDTKLAITNDGSWIPRTKFNEINQRNKDLEKQLQDRDKQLQDLEGKVTGNEELKRALQEAQEANKVAAEEWQAKTAKMQLDFAVERALAAAKAKNPKAVKALLDMAKVKLDGEQLLGLDDQLKELQKSDAYLFGSSESPQVGGGTNPPDAGGGEANPWKPETFNLTNQAKILQENPALAARLKQEAGVK